MCVAKADDRAGRSVGRGRRSGVEGLANGDGFSVSVSVFVFGLTLTLTSGRSGEGFRDSRKNRRYSAAACSFVARLYCTFLSILPGLNSAGSNLSI